MDNLNLSPLAIIFAFTTLNEAIIEYVFGSVKELHPYLPLIALSSGIFLAFLYQINIFSLVLNLQSGSPFLDFLLSGFIISRGSNFINDFARRILGSK